VTSVRTRAVLRPPAPARGADGFPRWCWTAVAATAAAGVLHLAVAADHVGASELVVAFFGGIALAQLATAVWLAVMAGTGERPGVGVLSALLSATVGLVCLYLVAHGTDLLAGLTAGAGQDGAAHGHGGGTTGSVAAGTEPPGLLGTVTVTAELLAVVALTALLPPRGRRLAGNVVLALGGAAWVLWLTGVLG
jgi:hypothetical protein